MSNPHDIITETYLDLNMEEVMNFRFDDDYEAFADTLFAEQEELYLEEPDDDELDDEWDDSDDGWEDDEDYTDEKWCD